MGTTGFPVVGQPSDFSNSLPAAPTGGVNVTFQAQTPTAPPTAVVRELSAYVAFSYDTVIYFPTIQSSATQEIFRENCRHTKNYPPNFSGTIAGASCISGGSAKTAATGSPVFTIYRNGTSVGTITWAASAVTPTFTTASGAALTINVGDIITITGPATADATLSNWSVTLVSTRTS